MKKRNSPRDVPAAVRAACRNEEISEHGKLVSFRKTMTKNKKKYSRKNNKEWLG